MQRSASLLDTPLVNTTYASLLAEDSPQFTPNADSSEKYYYELIQVIISSTGYYTLRSGGIIYTYSYFYTTSFDPASPETNLMAYTPDSAVYCKSKMKVNLKVGKTYYPVLTTYFANVVGEFIVTIIGVGEINLSPPDRKFNAVSMDTDSMF